MLRVILHVAIGLALLAAMPSDAATTAFTYQGKLTNSAGVPLTGSHDMTFKLYDADAGGAQVGSTVTLTGVNVSAGLFTVDLDFGASPFASGAARWLETTVAGTVLSPRAALTAAPYALFSAAPWAAATGGISYTGNVGIGTATPATSLDVAGTAKMTGFQLGASATAGQVLTADASGVGTWQALPAPPASLPPSGTAGGDLTGTYPNPELATNAASLAKVSGGAMASELGGVSIGTANLPGGPLEVYGDTATVDQEQTSQNGNIHGYGTYWQSFTAGADGALSAVGLYLGSYGSVTPWSATLKIWDGEGSGGTALSTQTIRGDGNVTARVFPLATPVAVVAGQKYTVGFSTAGISVQWQARNADVYPGGRCGYNAGYDYWFRTYLAALSSRPALVVQPATLNVGMGTAAPAAKLHVDGSSILTGDMGIGTTTPGFPLSFANVLGDKISLWGQSGAHYGFGIQSSLLQIYSASSGTDIAFGYGESGSMTETMRIRGSGNVGIGTSTPASKLDVAGTAKMTGFQLGASATEGQVLTANASGVGTWQALPAPPTTLPPSGPAGGDLTGTYPNPAVGTGKIDSAKILDGSVALADLAGNSVNSAKLVDGTIAAADLANDGASLAKVSGGAAAVSSGKVGIGTATPAFTLHINGTVGVVSLPQADKRNVQWDPVTGQLYQAISSRRFKENIAPLADEFEKLLAAEPKTYTQVNSPGSREIGYIAEDIDALGLKDLVHYGADGRPEALKYEKMVLYLVEIAKDQQRLIETERAANREGIAALQKQIDELKALLAAQASQDK